MPNSAKNGGKLYSLAEAARIAHAPVARILAACRDGIVPDVVLVERHGRTAYALTQTSITWLLLGKESHEKGEQRANSRTFGMLHMGGNYHAMRGTLGRDFKGVRHAGS